MSRRGGTTGIALVPGLQGDGVQGAGRRFLPIDRGASPSPETHPIPQFQQRDTAPCGAAVGGGRAAASDDDFVGAQDSFSGPFSLATRQEDLALEAAQLGESPGAGPEDFDGQR